MRRGVPRRMPRRARGSIRAFSRNVDTARRTVRIRVSDDRRARPLGSIKQHFAENFDEPISDFRAVDLLDFFVRELGPAVYNQGVRDASSFIQDKLTDIEGEVYERENP